MARRERPNASLRTTAEVLSRLAEAKPGRCLVPRESSSANLARTIRLDHGPRRFRADRSNCERKRSRCGAFHRSAGDGTRGAALSKHGRCVRGETGAVRCEDYSDHDGLVGTTTRKTRRMKIKEIGFVAIPITDIPRAREFYERILGLQVSDEMMGGKWIEYTVGDK